MPMGTMFTVSVPWIGTLTADNYVDFQVPWDCQLVGVSVDGDTNNFNIKVGSTSNDDAYVDTTDGAVTAGTVLVLDAKGDFVGDEYPHISALSTIRVTFDHTGSNPADVFMLLFFSMG